MTLPPRRRAHIPCPSGLRGSLRCLWFLLSLWRGCSLCVLVGDLSFPSGWPSGLFFVLQFLLQTRRGPAAARSGEIPVVQLVPVGRVSFLEQEMSSVITIRYCLVFVFCYSSWDFRLDLHQNVSAWINFSFPFLSLSVGIDDSEKSVRSPGLLSCGQFDVQCVC